MVGRRHGDMPVINALASRHEGKPSASKACCRSFTRSGAHGPAVATNDETAILRHAAIAMFYYGAGL